MNRMLLTDIEALRETLYVLTDARHGDVLHPDVLQISRRLDTLILDSLTGDNPPDRTPS